MANTERMKKIIPLITREISFGQDVCELVFGVNVTDLDFWVQIEPVKQPIQSTSVGSGNMSHRWTSTFDNHFDYRLIVLKDIQHGTGTIMYGVRWNVVNMFVGMTLLVCLNWMELCVFGLVACNGFLRSSSLGCSILFGTE